MLRDINQLQCDIKHVMHIALKVHCIHVYVNYQFETNGKAGENQYYVLLFRVNKAAIFKTL